MYFVLVKYKSLYNANKSKTITTTKMEKQIKIKEGYGDIRFGMPVEEVVQIMGPAEEVESVENALDEPTTLLHYEDGGLTLFFEGENPELQCIDLSVEESTLFGEKIFDMSEQELVKLMVANNYFEQDADEEAWGERRVSFGEGNIDFFYDDDELLAVVYGK